MTSFTPNISGTHTYRGSSEVNFIINERNELTVTIDTDRLHMRSVEATEEDYNSYIALFGDPDVMGKFATGQTKTPEETKARIKDSWVKRWNQNDPYAGLAVCKKDTKEFMGHVVLGYGDEPGQSEIAYLFMKKHWNQGYGTEAVTALVKEYAPATVQEGYTLEGKTLAKITGTVRHDNPASEKILINLGMRIVSEDEKYGGPRHHYSLDLKE